MSTLISKKLRAWVLEQLRQNLNFELSEVGWSSLKGDAGFRQYYRLWLKGKSYIAVFAPVESENSAEFIRISQWLKSYGVNSPEIYHYDLSHGFLLIEDLGEKTLFEFLAVRSADDLYGQAIDTLLAIQRAKPATSGLALYCKDRLHDELNVFTLWFIPKLLQYSVSDSEKNMLDEQFDVLLAELAEQPQVAVHRDFHSQNLMYNANGALGVVDFQDALIGPVTYDLVSILRDCYVAWPAEKVAQWVIQYREKAIKLGVLKEISQRDFERWFDWMGLQRHIKVMGIFARLYLRDGKDKYLGDLPLVIHYFKSVIIKYDELRPLSYWFDSTLLPIVEQQTWYNPVEVGEMYKRL